MNDFLTLSSTGFITFGIVWAVSLFVNLDSKYKFGLSVAVAILVSFIPNDLGSFIVNKIKDGFYVATGLSGMYQMGSKFIEKAGKSQI